MASVLDLVHESSEEIGKRAREEDVPKRGSMRKGEKIAALADESIHEDVVAEILLSKKTDDGNGLVGMAKELGVESPHSQTKAELQELLLEDHLGQTSEAQTSKGQSSESQPGGGASGADSRQPAASGRSGSGSMPPGREDPERMAKGASHFESAEERRAQIEFHLQQAAEHAAKNGMSYVVVESFRPQDAKEPMKVQRSYEKRHPDTMVVAEVTVPHYALPLETTDPNPVFRDND
jgi:hypothetical protein